MFGAPGNEAAAGSAASLSVLVRELLFHLVQGSLCLFGVDPEPPALDRSLAGFEPGRKFFIGQIGLPIIVSRRCQVFPQFDGNGIDALFRDLFATGGSPDDDAKRLGDLLLPRVMGFLELILHTSRAVSDRVDSTR